MENLYSSSVSWMLVGALPAVSQARQGDKHVHLDIFRTTQLRAQESKKATRKGSLSA